jgi:hypothetical protein
VTIGDSSDSVLTTTPSAETAATPPKQGRELFFMSHVPVRTPEIVVTIAVDLIVEMIVVQVVAVVEEEKDN